MIENDNPYQRSQSLLASLKEEMGRLQNNEDGLTVRNRLLFASITEVKIEIEEGLTRYQSGSNSLITK